VAIDNSGRSKGRSILGLLMLIGGGLLVIPAFQAEPPSSALPGIGLGLALILGAVLVLGPVIAKPLSRLVGLPLPAIKGVTGRLARENAMRSPRRTASTASALIIGVTLVGFITVFAASAQESISNTVSGGFQGEYIIQPANLNGNLSGLPLSATEQLRSVKGVDSVAAVAVTIGKAKIDNATGPDRNAAGQIAGIDPVDFQNVFKTTMDEGTLNPLGADQIVVDSALAKSKDIALGSKITITTLEDKTATFEVSGISDDLAVLSLYGFQFVTSDAGFAKLSTAPTDFLVGISLDSGTNQEAMRSQLKAPIKDFPTMKLQDREQFTGTLVAQIKALLNVIYGLLAVSIVIALIGIANTLSLSINERTRELGLLRAMGMSRRQLRSMVRWEAVIVALMGTGLGVILGLGLSWILVKGLASQGIDTFKVPVTGLVIEVIFGAGLGILASFNPARRAAKLNVLDAIATE
jgi:putative ABC transport system permease protein